MLWDIVLSSCITAVLLGGGMLAYDLYLKRKQQQYYNQLKLQLNDVLFAASQGILAYYVAKGTFDIGCLKSIVEQFGTTPTYKNYLGSLGIPATAIAEGLCPSGKPYAYGEQFPKFMGGCTTTANLNDVISGKYPGSSHDHVKYFPDTIMSPKCGPDYGKHYSDDLYINTTCPSCPTCPSSEPKSCPVKSSLKPKPRFNKKKHLSVYDSGSDSESDFGTEYVCACSLDESGKKLENDKKTKHTEEVKMCPINI